MYWIKMIALLVLTFLMVTAGVTHFRSPTAFVSIVPASLPYPLQLVYISGFFEILGGLGLLLPPTRRAASFGLIALFLAVFPANVNMAIHDIPIDGRHFDPWILWLRLPFQLFLIAWAWWTGGISGPHSQTPAGISTRTNE